MEVRFWAQTDVGRQRDHNEDNFLIDRRLSLFIIADGMGGHAAGEVASAAAVHEIRKYVNERQGVVKAYGADPAGVGAASILGLLEGAVRHACATIHELAQANPARRGMGSTVDVLLVAGDRGFIAHVGDSRVYMLRQGKVHQMTEDHSLVNELIRRGRLKPGQAFDSPFKNAVTRAVGVYPSVDVDTIDFDILPGDRFLLCSDGLSGYTDVRPEVLEREMSHGDPTDVARRLIDFANESGGKDNITALIVEAFPKSEELAALMASELRTKIEALRGIPLIRYLNYMELVKLLNVTETTVHPPGSVILREADPGDRFYVLLEGRVRVLKGDAAIADLETGAHFGEMALVDDAPRSATIKALEECKTLAILREKFYELLRQDSQLAVKMLWAFVQVLTVRLRLSSSELAERKTEHELVSQMESIFNDSVTESGRALGDSLDGLPSAEPVDLGLSMAEAEVRELQGDDSVMAPATTFDVLAEEARRATGTHARVATPRRAGADTQPGIPAQRRSSRAEEDWAALRASAEGEDEESDVVSTVVGLPALPLASPAPPAARAATAGMDDSGDDDDDEDTSPGRALPGASGAGGAR